MKQTKRPLAHILVVDDEEDLLILMQAILQNEGYSVTSSPNADNIFELIHDHRPDVILLDITLRGRYGGDICKQLKTSPNNADIPVIIFSANHNAETITRECGADGLIMKPFDIAYARNLFRQVLAK